MVLSSNEKQIRFRKKEELKKEADRIFRDWQFRGWHHLGLRNMEDVRKALDEIVDLKSNWTEADYKCALKALVSAFFGSSSFSILSRYLILL